MFVNTFLFKFFKLFETIRKRRRRDLNPRAAINELHPFQGCPFSLLGTSPNSLNYFSLCCISSIKPPNWWFIETEKVGFEPTAPYGVTGFQDRLLKPLGHLSGRCFASISPKSTYVNSFCIYFVKNLYIFHFSAVLIGFQQLKYLQVL